MIARRSGILGDHFRRRNSKKNPKTLTLRMETGKAKQQDGYAEQDQGESSYLLNVAVDRYLDVRQLHAARIEEATRQAVAPG
jgi:hypothetical protein